MDWIVRLMAVASASLAVLGFKGDPLSTPESKPYGWARTWSVTATTTTTTTTAPLNLHCPEWQALAGEAGWHADSMLTLDYVMWRESRCQANAHNKTLNADGSTDIGLMQINDRSWCLPTRWYPQGYLQTVGMLDSVGCAELFDPLVNLKAAKALYDYSEEASQNGWRPWKVHVHATAG
jgi:hypothetical protein